VIAAVVFLTAVIVAVALVKFRGNRTVGSSTASPTLEIRPLTFSGDVPRKWTTWGGRCRRIAGWPQRPLPDRDTATRVTVRQAGRKNSYDDRRPERTLG
jgi:hypothetical protein